MTRRRDDDTITIEQKGRSIKTVYTEDVAQRLLDVGMILMLSRIFRDSVVSLRFGLRVTDGDTHKHYSRSSYCVPIEVKDRLHRQLWRNCSKTTSQRQENRLSTVTDGSILDSGSPLAAGHRQ